MPSDMTKDHIPNSKRAVLSAIATACAYFLAVQGVALFIAPLRVFVPLALVNGLVCMASVVWFIAFVGPATQSRRLKFKLMVLLGYIELPCWGVVALVFCVFSRSFQEPGMAVWCTGIGFAAVFLPILALIEAKTMSWYWSGCIKTGLINLDKGLYDQEKPEPEYSSGAPWWLIPSNVGVASLVIGYSCVMVLATVMDIPIGAGDMVTGFALAALAGMIQALFWPMGAGLLLRVIRWERATGRKMLVTPGEDDMEMEGQNAD